MMSQSSDDLPEAILGMSVVKVRFPRLYGRKAAENQNRTVLIDQRSEGMMLPIHRKDGVR